MNERGKEGRNTKIEELHERIPSFVQYTSRMLTVRVVRQFLNINEKTEELCEVKKKCIT